MVAQSENDLYSCRVSKHPEDFDRQLDILAVRKPAANHVICIHTQIIA